MYTTNHQSKNGWPCISTFGTYLSSCAFNLCFNSSVTVYYRYRPMIKVGSSNYIIHLGVAMVIYHWFSVIAPEGRHLQLPSSPLIPSPSLTVPLHHQSVFHRENTFSSLSQRDLNCCHAQCMHACMMHAVALIARCLLQWLFTYEHP